MKLLIVATALLTLAAKKEAAPPAPEDPNAASGKAYGGKVWVQRESIPVTGDPELHAWLGRSQPINEIVRKDKDGPWLINYVAVFKKPSLKGPMTVQFAEKSSPKEIVDQYSPENESAALVFLSTYDLTEDKGFNRNKTYLVRVGQLIKNKFVSYAQGEFSLK